MKRIKITRLRVWCGLLQRTNISHVPLVTVQDFGSFLEFHCSTSLGGGTSHLYMLPYLMTEILKCLECGCNLLR